MLGVGEVGGIGMGGWGEHQTQCGEEPLSTMHDVPPLRRRCTVYKNKHDRKKKRRRTLQVFQPIVPPPPLLLLPTAALVCRESPGSGGARRRGSLESIRLSLIGHGGGDDC